MSHLCFGGIHAGDHSSTHYFDGGLPCSTFSVLLRNVARRLLESVRFVRWEVEWFNPRRAGKLRIALDSS